MAKLPNVAPSDPILTRWQAIINAVLGLPLNNAPSFLQNVEIIDGVTVINHLLGRTPQGWFIVDSSAAVNPYRSAPFNSLTLTLTSGAATTISLIIF